MDPNVQIEIDEQIIAEASSWIAQLESGNLSGADLAALREWTARSPAHANEIRAIAELSGSMQVLTECLEFLENNQTNSLRKKKYLQPAIVSLAAVFTLFCGFLAYSNTLDKSQSDTMSLITQKGESRTLTLSDGSSIHANTNSEIRVVYSQAARKVELLRGEALFKVAHAPERPFTVVAGDFKSEALGTSFSVKLNKYRTELSVVEGVVAFSKIGTNIEVENLKQPAEQLVLNAGQTISTSNVKLKEASLSVAQISILTDKDIVRRLSWTEGLLEFSDTPLHEVVSEVNRYVHTPISIVDEDLNDIQIGGIYRTGDTIAMLEAFERLGIDVDRSNPDKISLKTNKKSPLKE